MEIAQLNKHRLKPWSIEGTGMPPQVLLMSKLLYILLLCHGFLFDLNDPFIPFVSSLDYFNNMPGLIKFIVRVVFIVSGLFLLFNVKVRLNSLILGLVVIFGIVASKPLFRNHLFIVGCALFLAGLSDRDNAPVLIYWQMSLLYLATFLSKASDLDWWSGQFMHNWMNNAIENPYYLLINSILPGLWVAKLFSWSTIFLELIIGISLLTKKTRFFAVWTVILFHAFLFSFVGHKFGFFVDDIFIILISFLAWPKNRTQAEYGENANKNVLSVMKFLDTDRLIVWNKMVPDQNNFWLKVQSEDEIKTNYRAMASLLLYSPGFYMLLFSLNLMIDLIDIHLIRYILFLSMTWSLIFFFVRYDLLPSK